MKKIIWIIIIIITILFVAASIYIYNLIGNNKYDLKSISDVKRNEIITILHCNEISNEIELMEMQIPKVYKDIYYEIYLKTDNQNIKDYVSKIETDLYGIDFKELNKNNYRCVVYRKDDKSIDILEALRNEK